MKAYFNKIFAVFVYFFLCFFLFFGYTFAVDECPEGVIGTLKAIPYAERSNPDSNLGGFSECTYNGELYSYCSDYLTTTGYCMPIEDWVSAQQNCCTAEQTVCTNDGKPGICSDQGLGHGACESNKSCSVIDEEIDMTDPGSVTCRCRVGEAGLWFCQPFDLAGELTDNPSSNSCEPWASIDETNCGSGIERPSWCNEDSCTGSVPCISKFTENGEPLKGHGEDCTWSIDSDECDTSKGLQCVTVEGTDKCVYKINSRGGPGDNNSCLYDFECITELGLNSDPSSDYECTASPGVLCNPQIHSSCSCTPPEGTWKNGEEVETSPAVDIYDICASNLSAGSDAFKACSDCNDNEGLWTSIGCIEKNPTGLISKLITIGTGILGGIFLIRVLTAAFMLVTSQGDVKKTSEAKEMITEAIIGVLFIIFSVTILQFFGSEVMKIPGFGG